MLQWKIFLAIVLLLETCSLRLVKLDRTYTKWNLQADDTNTEEFSRVSSCQAPSFLQTSSVSYFEENNT